MAVVLGNWALLLDVTSPRIVLADRKARPLALDVVLSLHKRDLSAYYAAIVGKSFEADGEARSQRIVARGKANSKKNGGVEFESDEEENWESNGLDEEEKLDWEKEMRKRVKEIEERRELEKKAEEIQSKVEEEGSEGIEETEEEKRMRVRKELEKVCYLANSFAVLVNSSISLYSLSNHIQLLSGFHAENLDCLLDYRSCFREMRKLSAIRYTFALCLRLNR